MGIRESTRITEGLRYLDHEVSASRDEFRKAMHPGGAALLEACESLGFLRRGKTAATIDRVVLTDAGQRRLAAAEPAPAADE